MKWESVLSDWALHDTQARCATRYDKMSRTNCCPTGLSEFKRGIGIAVHKNLLNTHLLWLILPDQFIDMLVDLTKPLRRIFTLNLEIATMHIADPVWLIVYQAKSGASRSRIYTQNNHSTSLLQSVICFCGNIGIVINFLHVV